MWRQASTTPTMLCVLSASLAPQVGVGGPCRQHVPCSQKCQSLPALLRGGSTSAASGPNRSSMRCCRRRQRPNDSSRSSRSSRMMSSRRRMRLVDRSSASSGIPCGWAGSCHEPEITSHDQKTGCHEGYGAARHTLCAASKFALPGCIRRWLATTMQMA